MKFFIDTANIEEIREINSWGVLSGVTTNPTLIAKSGGVFEDVIKEITEIVDGDISAEVISTDLDGMLKEARELAKISKNIVIQKDNNYDTILESLGIYRVIDPKVIVANEIIKAINTDMKVSINYMFGGKAQVYEIKIPDDFVYIGKKLSEINLHKEIIIGGIIRYDNSAVIPRGNTKIEKGDRLVIFSTNESRKELEELIDPSLKKSIFDFFRR